MAAKSVLIEQEEKLAWQMLQGYSLWGEGVVVGSMAVVPEEVEKTEKIGLVERVEMAEQVVLQTETALGHSCRHCKETGGERLQLLQHLHLATEN